MSESGKIAPPAGRKAAKGSCRPDCPYLQPFIHPFFCHSAWCGFNLRQLFWYDGAYIAQCEHQPPDPQNQLLVEKGWQGNPDYKKGEKS